MNLLQSVFHSKLGQHTFCQIKSKLLFWNYKIVCKNFTEFIKFTIKLKLQVKKLFKKKDSEPNWMIETMKRLSSYYVVHSVIASGWKIIQSSLWRKKNSVQNYGYKFK